MERDYLYSPWRLDYIISEKESGCLFCRIANSLNDKDDLVVYRSQSCFVLLNRYPYNNGHIMVVPFIHCSRLSDLPNVVFHNVFSIVQKAEQVISDVYHCDGINIGINIGKSAGAGIEDHIHVHLVPRWNGDNNFMTVIAGQRVIPEDFMIAWEKLNIRFNNLFND